MFFKKKCRLIDIDRGTAYYRLNYSKEKDKRLNDLKIKDEIEKIQLDFPYYGHRTIKAELKRRKNWIINKKRLIRIMREYGLKSQLKRLFKSFTESRHNLRKYPNLIKDLLTNSINQIWGADITYIRVKNEFIYLAVIIDLYSRKIKGWALSRNIDANLTIAALERALKNNSKPDIHHSDQGVQYCAKEYVEILKEKEIKISMSDKANPFQNAICESFFKTLKYNEVYLNEYDDYEEALNNIKEFIEIVYHRKRLHSSLGYLPPAEFEENIIKQRKVEQKQTINNFNNLKQILPNLLTNP